MSYVELLDANEARPTNPEWHELRRAGVSASEIAIVLGISSWGSPFSLYWQKVNGWETDDNELMSAGRRLEPTLADWWAEQNMDLRVRPAGLYAHTERRWQLATPDRLVYAPAKDRPGVFQFRTILECKWVAHSWDGWGVPGTDEIPVYYRTQVLQQCDVMGVDDWHLAALGPGGFRAYYGRRDDKDIRVMRAAGAAFAARLKAGEPPELDNHTATIATLQKLHPTVEDYDVQVPAELAEGYRRARALRSRIEDRITGYEARIRDAIGNGRRAICNERLVASRSVYERTGEDYDLHALDGITPIVDRLNPGRAKSYV